MEAQSLHLLFIAIVDFYAFAFSLLDTFRIVRVYIVFFHRRNDHSCARSDSVGVTEYLAVLFIYMATNDSCHSAHEPSS